MFLSFVSPEIVYLQFVTCRLEFFFGIYVTRFAAGGHEAAAAALGLVLYTRLTSNSLPCVSPEMFLFVLVHTACITGWPI